MPISLISLLMFLGLAQQRPTWRDEVPRTWGPMNEGWRVGVFSEKQQYVEGEPTDVVIKARNETGARLEVSLIKSPWITASRMVVIRVSDNQVMHIKPPHDMFDRLRRHSSGASTFFVDPGGFAYCGTIDLQAIFELGVGEYSITVHYYLPNSPGAALVPSNPLMITVRPAEPPRLRKGT